MMYHNKSGQVNRVLGHRTKRAIEIGISLLLIPLLLLSIGLTTLPVRAADTYDFEAYKNTITDDDVVESLSKEYVFKDETFIAKAVGSATLLQDFSFNNVVEVQYKISAQSEFGNSIVLGSYTGSAGPLLNLKSGTRLSYTLLDTPLVFPSTAVAGDYTINLEITGVTPDFVWNAVQENVDAADLIMKLGSIKYLGMERPQIKLSLTTPSVVTAGDSFPVGLEVNSPAGVDQVNISLSTQTSGGTPVLFKELSVAGTTSQTENFMAPMYNGELKFIASVTDYTVLDTVVTPTTQVSVITNTWVNLIPPSMSLIVSNPVTAGNPVNFKLKVKNPYAFPVSMGVYLLPEWDVPAWSGADLSWFFAEVQTISLAAKEEKEFSLSVSPVTVAGKTYKLKAQFTQYQLLGQTIKTATPIVAEAIVTTATNPVGQLTLSRASVYPYEGFNVDALMYNPGAGSLSASYQIRVTTGSKVEDLFGTTYEVWKSGGSAIPAGTSSSLSFAGPTANQEQKYVGFELVLNGESLARTSLYVKAVAPPTIKVIPSTLAASAGQNINLAFELQNQMGVETSFNLQILQRIWNGAAWVESNIGAAKPIVLDANGKSSATASTTTPTDPVIVEYGARISQMTLSSANFTVDKSNWVRVDLNLVVLPQITLALNPNIVQVGSSMEIKGTVYNQSDKAMTVPLSIYIKPPSSFRNLLETREVNIPAGGSTSFSKYLKVEESWGSLGSMEVIVKASQLTYGGTVIPLAAPIEVSKSCTIMNLKLKAALKTQVVGYHLSFDASNYLVMDSVEMTGTIVITNVGGWQSCPELTLNLQVPASNGVTLLEGWQVVSTETKGLLGGGELITTARISITGPTAANLANVSFVARVNAGGTNYDFTLGMFRVASGSWILDGNAKMVNASSGSRFASPSWDSDNDGLSDYMEMIEKNTNPLNAADPGSITPAEKAQSVKNLEAEVSAFVFRAGQFIDTVDNGGSLLPSGKEAWNRMMVQGQSAQDGLQLLKNLTLDPKTALTTTVNALVVQINDLESTIDEKYGDSSTPIEIRAMAIQTILGMNSSEANSDPDNDGLPTAVELGLGYDPNRWDSQQPGVSDKNYLASTVAEGANTQDKVLLGSYVSLGQMGRLIEDMKGSLPEGSLMTEADEQALLKQAQQDLMDATWEYISAFFI